MLCCLTQNNAPNKIQVQKGILLPSVLHLDLFKVKSISDLKNQVHLGQ